MPIEGSPNTLEAQEQFTAVLQAASAADGNGTIADLWGLDGAAYVEILNSTAGTATITLEGSFDRANWYAAGFQQVDATAAPARSVTPISVTASPFGHVYQLLDHYPYLRARQSGSAAAPAVTVTIRALAN